MCGIAGFVGKGEQHELERMIDALKHRGPDDRGVFLDGGVGLAHARLSIIDISPSGHQPMFSSDRSAAIVFNGEIYNFRELKEELSAEGRVFTTGSDTEVILHAYERWGTDCFKHLNGMFAIAIYDFPKKSLILARDRMGKKPLYWSQAGGTVLFGSELRALSCHHLFKKKLDLVSVNKYFAYGYVPTPHTIFEGVRKLEPGTFLEHREGAIRTGKFWAVDQREADIDLAEAIRIVDRELDRSVKARLIADVPLGIFLSGGLDSSTIAYYAQKHSKRKIKTFSVGFHEKSFDESAYAREVAEHLGTDHHHVMLPPDEALKVIPSLLDLIDEPIADPSIVPTYLLSKHTRREVTVALGGDGGDELFAGYPTFQADVFVAMYRRIPAWIRKNIIGKLVNALAVSDKNFSLGFKVRKFVEGVEGDPKYLHQRWLSVMDDSARRALFNPDTWEKIGRKNVFEDVDRYRDEVAAMPDERNRVLYEYMRTYMMDQVLVKVDRASMLNALEVRAPFLDRSIVDFVAPLPYAFKLRNLRTKYILKELMKDRLPKRIVMRTKKGFGLPIARWLKGDLKEFCDETLSRKNIDGIGVLNYGYVEGLKQDHFSGRADNARQLWALMVFVAWHKRNFAV
ncbi:asparagine synthase (glutamine-hydrolyzing) [Patescibacteria group bacterium]|nr:asparagine synthase (glutamine-hydrolyzing) [Patescibacteria group bacterium]